MSLMQKITLDNLMFSIKFRKIIRTIRLQVDIIKIKKIYRKGYCNECLGKDHNILFK